MKHTIVPILKFNNKRYAHSYPTNEIKSGHIITIRGDKYLALNHGKVVTAENLSDN
jgi:hypothetical protein